MMLKQRGVMYKRMMAVKKISSRIKKRMGDSKHLFQLEYNFLLAQSSFSNYRIKFGKQLAQVLKNTKHLQNAICS